MSDERFLDKVDPLLLYGGCFWNVKQKEMCFFLVDVTPLPGMGSLSSFAFVVENFKLWLKSCFEWNIGFGRVSTTICHCLKNYPGKKIYMRASNSLCNFVGVLHRTQSARSVEGFVACVFQLKHKMCDSFMSRAVGSESLVHQVHTGTVGPRNWFRNPSTTTKWWTSSRVRRLFHELRFSLDKIGAV